MGLGDSPEEDQLEAAFLQQDCWFLNFSGDEDEDLSLTYHQKDHSQVKPIFGSIHPYEGIRSLKEEEEVLPIYIALKALARFMEECDRNLLLEDAEEPIEREYKFKIPLSKSFLKIKLTTRPEFTDYLEEMWDEGMDDEDDDDKEYRS